jgi:hypothetical protein
MKTLFLLLLLLPSICFAGESLVEGVVYTYDDEFSFKDFTNKSLKDIGDSLNNKTIYRTCFSQETPDSVIFPADMIGVTFVYCNLDNVYIPPGNTVIESSQVRFKVQEDGKDWIVDENNNPIELR